MWRRWGRAFEHVPADTEERVVFALKYADEKMDIPALLDACDMIDPMVDHRSVTTSIAQFRAYDQQKRAAARDHRNTATTHRSQERLVDDPSEFQRCDARAPIRAPVVFDEEATARFIVPPSPGGRR